jgi:hypothetical protein
MRRSLTSLFVAAFVAAAGLFVATPAAKSSTGPFDFNLDVIGSGVAGTTLSFVITGAAPDAHYVIVASPNMNGQTFDPFPSPLGDAPPFELCVGNPSIVVTAGSTDVGGSAMAARRVPGVLRPQAAGRNFFFQAFYLGRDGRRYRGFVSDVENSFIQN